MDDRSNTDRLAESCIFGTSKNWRFDFCLTRPDGGVGHLEGAGGHGNPASLVGDLVAELCRHLSVVNGIHLETRNLGGLAAAFMGCRHAGGRSFSYHARLSAEVDIKGSGFRGPVEARRDFIDKLAAFLEEQQDLPPFPDPCPWWSLEARDAWLRSGGAAP